MNAPAELKYTKDHEWVRIEGNTAIVGITDFAQGELGDVVFVDFDPSLSDVKKGESIGTIEAVKTVSDLFMPMSGEILEMNAALEDHPELVNNDPYGDGWMIKVAINDLAELDTLLDAAAYEALIG